MSIPQPQFPNNVWNGLSSNPFRKTRELEEGPNHQDWDQAVSELVATQTNLLSAQAKLAIADAVRTVSTTTYIITTSDCTILIDAATPATVTLTLPDATTCVSKVFKLKRIDSVTGHTVTLGCSNSQTIEGVATKTLATQWAFLAVQSDGANWIIIK